MLVFILNYDRLLSYDYHAFDYWNTLFLLAFTSTSSQAHLVFYSFVQTCYWDIRKATRLGFAFYTRLEMKSWL